MTRQLRDELGQGLTIGVLAGMRSVVADLVWLNVTTAWDEPGMVQDGRLTSISAPRCSRARRSFGTWAAGNWPGTPRSPPCRTATQPNELRRLKASRFWIDRGLEIYKRGIENNPDLLEALGGYRLCSTSSG